MHIAVEGCSHGELDIIYRSVERLEKIHNLKIDLLICCGDFQSVRNEKDLKCMAVPIKYMQMHDFHKYYSGEKKAPVLTIFIGGNHEASNYLQELPYGGWVAPNIYYVGYAGVVRFGDLRIGGLSGIYKGHDYLKGHYECTPYNESSCRSVYHIRNLEVFRLKQVSGVMDIFMSHDWPRGIWNFGNVKKLLKTKSFFEEDIRTNRLGSRPAEDLLQKLQPKYWFSGHLHVKFSALVKHETSDEDVKGEEKVTKFLALDKCLPRREFLQVLEMPQEAPPLAQLTHDIEWLTVLRLTNHLINTQPTPVYMPGPGSGVRYNFTPTAEEIAETLTLLGGDDSINLSDFVRSGDVFDSNSPAPDMRRITMPKEPLSNAQTLRLCDLLGLDDPIEMLKSVNVVESTPKRKQAYDATDMDATTSPASTNGREIRDSSTIVTPNREEVNFSDGEFELFRDSVSGDFIMEFPTTTPKSAASPKEVTHLTQNEADDYNLPLPSRSPDMTRKRLSLSVPKCHLSPPSLNADDDLATVASASADSASSLTPEENDKKESFEVVETPLKRGDGGAEGGAMKKLKRRNVALYSLEDV